jgi:hypothetical protein
LAVAVRIANSFIRKASRKMSIRMSKVTNCAIILAAALGLVLSPTVDPANPAANSRRNHTQVVSANCAVPRTGGVNVRLGS